MADPRFVFDATPDNFRTLVLANSEKGPVAVNFWSPRAGPCLMLTPRLLTLAEKFGGRFALAPDVTGCSRCSICWASRTPDDPLPRRARGDSVLTVRETSVQGCTV